MTLRPVTEATVRNALDDLDSVARQAEAARERTGLTRTLPFDTTRAIYEARNDPRVAARVTEVQSRWNVTIGGHK